MSMAIKSKQKGDVLVVDDEEVIRTLCQRVLVKEGYRVETAEDGKHAREAVKGRDYDAVVADIRLPDISGVEVLKSVKQMRPNTEVILITGFGSKQTAIKAVEFGASSYLEKPFSNDDLVERVRRAVLRREELKKREQESKIWEDHCRRLSEANQKINEELLSLATMRKNICSLDKTQKVELHPAEAKLINLIRSVGFGEIEALKIQNGLPITYKMIYRTGKFS